MRKKTHNLYIQLSHTGHRLWKPADLRLCLLARNSFLLALLLTHQCWLSTVLPLIKKEVLSSKLHLIVTTISQPRRWSQSSNLTIAVCSFIFYYVLRFVIAPWTQSRHAASISLTSIPLLLTSLCLLQYIYIWRSITRHLSPFYRDWGEYLITIT